MKPINPNKQAVRNFSLLVLLLCIGGCASFSHKDSASLTSDPLTSETPATAAPSVQPGDAEWAPSSISAAPEASAPAPAVKASSPLVAHADLWDRIRAGYALPPLEDSPYIRRHEQWFANNPEYMENMINRAQLYLYYIVEEVEKRGMPMEIALLPAIESAYQPHAFSRARAVGLWQFMPATGRLYGLKANWWYDGRRDVIASTQAALDYLAKLNKEFDGDWQLALAAYNCGEGKVGRLMAQNRRKGLPTTYQDLKLPRETVNYVPKLMAMVNIITHPEKYGLKLASIPNAPYFAQVDIGSQVDLGVVAKLADLPVAELYQINPEHVRWITDPNGSHQLLIPANKKDALLAGLSTLANEDRVQWSHHEVRRGDIIGKVAQHYGISVDAIRSANRLNTNLLRVGQNLLIPVSTSKTLSASYVPSAAPARINDGEHGKVRVTHRVRSGDTLWSIAKRYNVYVHQLRQWNLMGTRDMLKRGQRLKIWTQPASIATRVRADDST